MNRSGVLVAFLQLIRAALAAATVVVLARFLSAEDYGRFVYYSTVWAILPLLAGWGSEHVFLMQASREPALIPPLFGNALAVRSATTLVLVAAAAIWIKSTGQPDRDAVLAIALGSLLAVFPNPLFLALYRVRAEHIRPWLLGFIGPALYLVYLLLIPGEHGSLWLAALGFLGSNVVSVLVCVPDIVRFGRPRLDGRLFRRFLRPGMVFSASQGFDFVSARIDVLLIQHLAGPYAVGIYAAAQRIVATLQIIPSSFHVVELPEFHRESVDRQALAVRFQRLRALMLESGLLLAGLLGVTAEGLVLLLFGPGYLASAPVLQVLALFAVVLFVSYPYYMLAEAMDRITARLVAKIAATVLAGGAITFALTEGSLVGAAGALGAGQLAFVIGLHALTRPCSGGWRHLGREGFSVALVAMAVIAASAVQSFTGPTKAGSAATVAVYLGAYGAVALLSGRSQLWPLLVSLRGDLRVAPATPQ